MMSFATFRRGSCTYKIEPEKVSFVYHDGRDTILVMNDREIVVDGSSDEAIRKLDHHREKK